jgi:hypothetical protein
MKENPGIPQENSEPSFVKKPYGESGSLYIFDTVGIIIDTSGKNYKELPELLFGTFDKGATPETSKPMYQPKTRRVGVDMNKVVECLKIVATDSGVHEFWIYPFGDDKPDNKSNREEARLRLFRRYGDLTPAPNNFGYILKI